MLQVLLAQKVGAAWKNGVDFLQNGGAVFKKVAPLWEKVDAVLKKSE